LDEKGWVVRMDVTKTVKMGKHKRRNAHVLYRPWRIEDGGLMNEWLVVLWLFFFWNTPILANSVICLLNHPAPFRFVFQELASAGMSSCKALMKSVVF
jgi:hypothetical protein